MRFYNASFLLGGLIALAIVPGTASASVTVSSSQTAMTITGDDDNDEVGVSYVFVQQGPVSSNNARVTNPAGVVPGPGCLAESTTSATCTEPEETITADLGGGVDRFRPDFDLLAATTARGEGGNDILGPGGTIDGGEGDDLLLADYGSGRIIGGPGADTARASEFEGFFAIGTGSGGSRVEGDVERVEGSPYEDSFSIGPGAHPNLVVAAGGGLDLVSYGAQTGGVTASLDDVANDGPGSGQNLIDVEDLVGGGGNDTLTGNGEVNTIAGGPSDDRLAGGGSSDQLGGGSGNDTLNGGDGGDTLEGGSGGDTLRGEGGDDVVSYSGSSVAVTVSLDGQANDGASGEGDDVGPDFERVFGSDEDDTITGGGGAEELFGGAGSDKIDGGGGADKVRGGSGDDNLKGGAGADDVRGNTGDDTLDGGPGEDLLIGQDSGTDGFDDGDGDGGGSGTPAGPRGVDTLELRDGEKDTAACPAGISRVFADQIDIVAATCLVERTPAVVTPPPPPPVVTPTAPSGPTLRVTRRGIRVDKRGVARIRVSCPKGAVPCAGVLRLVAVSRKKPAIVATLVYAIPGGKARTLRVKLNKRGRSLLRARRGVLRVDVTVAARAKGSPQTKVQSLRLRRG